MRFVKAAFFFLLILLTGLTLLSLAHVIPPETERTELLLFDQTPDGYEQLIALRQEGLAVTKYYSKYLLDRISGRTAYVQAEDMRILPRLEQGLPGRFFPHYRSTIVLVLPAGADAPPLSFSSLESSGYRLYFSLVHRTRIMPAMELALGGGDNLDKATSLLSGLRREGRLVVGQSSWEYRDFMDGNTVALMPDDEAAKLILSGLPVRIQVPSDGTLSFAVGLFAPSEASPEIIFSSSEISSAGLRALDGRADPLLYPEAAAYAPAVNALDVDSFLSLANSSVVRFRRDVAGTHLFNTATGSERLLVWIPLAAVLVFWGVSLYWRIVQPALRRLLQTQSGLLIIWLLLQLLKQTSDQASTRLIWYLYYLPLLGSVLIFQFATLEIEDAGPKQKRRFRLALSLVSGFFLLLVLTNDLHQLVFRFSDLPFQDHYSHEFGFFLLAGWIVLLPLDGLRRLIRCAGSRHNRRYLGLIALVIFAMMGYTLLYVLEVPFIVNTQVAQVFIVFILIFWELTMRSGLIPYNRNYTALFRFSKLPLYLLGRDGVVAMQSEGAEQLPEEVVRETLAGRRRFYGEDAPEARLGPDYEASEITGGYVIWKNDLRDIRRLAQSLRQVRQGLMHQTALLETQVEQEMQLREVSARRHLYEKLDRLIRPRLDEVEYLAEALSPALPPARLRSDLRTIGRQLGFCKRAGLLYLNAFSKRAVPARLLALLLRETFAEFREDGLETGLFGEPDGEIALQTAICVLTFVDSLLTQAQGRAQGSLLGLMNAREDGLTITLIWELPRPLLEHLAGLAEERARELEECGLRLRTIWEEPSLRLVLRKEAARDD
jgi:hypothetical protein